MGLEQNFLYDNFKKYQEHGVKALKKGDNGEAKKYLLKAAQTLFKLAAQSQGTLKTQWEESATNIYEKALAIKVDGESNSTSPYRGGGGGPRGKLKNQPDDTGNRFVPMTTVPDISFDDVIGLEDVKRYIKMNVIKPFENPEVFKLFKKEAGGGALLYGPPGTGKTMIAKAIANEVGAAFYSVKASDIMSKWVGESEQNVRNLFEAVRSHDLTVLFIDEIESITTKRGSHHSSVLDRVVSEFLAQLDGFNETSENVTMLLAATNVPSKIDEAIMRPGRFDRLIYIPLPNIDARRAILYKMIDEVPIEDDLDVDMISEITEGFSGADLKGLVETAKTYAIERTLDTGETSVILDEDFLEAMKGRTPSTTNALMKEYAKFKEDRQYTE
jgi:SpoVK/Ycf46/Vps4 family AAA+-type ATPase